MKKWRSIEEENQAYWTDRAKSYSEGIREELSGSKSGEWLAVIEEEISSVASDRGVSREELRILEIGCGPGFLSILLASHGYHVTAIDYTENMLSEARRNAAGLAAPPKFIYMNAEELGFSDSSFDMVVSRNVTWNLPHPKQAYCEWKRVLACGGRIVVFDANYYRFLFDEKARAGYEADRFRMDRRDGDDIYINTDTEAMEAIARQVPFSKLLRPDWDVTYLESLGMSVTADTEIYKRVWTENELLNQMSMPMFKISAKK